MLYQVQERSFSEAIADFLDKSDFAVEDKDIVIDFADTHSLGDSAVSLDTGSQKLIGQLAIFKSEHAKFPAH